MNRQPLLIVDGNAIGYANHNAMKLTVGDMQVQAIFGFLKALRSSLNTVAIGHKPLVLWDGRAQFRLDIYPEYKGNRKPLTAADVARKEAYRKQVPLIEFALESLGVTQIRSPRLEADDYAAHVLNADPGRMALLLTGDTDWLQLVRTGVDWYDPIRDNMVVEGNFFEKTGYKTPRAFIEGKALIGDTSDNIPPVGGLGKDKGAPELLATYGSVYSLFEAYDAGHAMKLGKAVTALCQPEGRAKFELNMNLMDLSRARKPEPGETVIKPGKYAPDKFKAFCERMAFASILRELPQFLAAFEPRSK